MPIEKPQIAQEIEKQAEFAYPKEQERLAQIESDKAAEQERLKRQKLIDEKGADYVVDQNWSSEYGLMWGSYKRGTIYFADGTISYSKMIFVDDSYGFEGSTTLTGDKKILYLTFEDAAKDAYRLAKGLSRSNEGRYYPEETTYTSSSNSSYSNSSSNTNNSVLNKGNICDDYNNSSINSPAYKYDGDWRCDGYNCNIKHRDVRFDDGTFGKIHLTSSGYSIGWTYDYYKSEYYAIRALYFYEKCNKTTSIGKGKN